MNWAQEQRQKFIARCLVERGIVNRSDVMNEFRVTAAIASSDLREFKKLNPGLLTYNLSSKRYEVGPIPSQKEGDHHG